MMNFILIYLIFVKSKVISLNLNKKKNSKLKKNLIIGAVTNYKWRNIAPFIKSYVMSNIENCDCILFVHNISQYTIYKIKSFGIIVYNIPKIYRNKSIINIRWKLYTDYLIPNSDKYNLVLSVDVRDVFFQSDPFEYYNGNKSFLGVAIEDGILAHGINKKWLLDAYGEKLHKTIKHQRIICVGTIWGTVDKFILFSNEMWKQLDSERSLRLNIIEQAVGNYIIYHSKLFKDCLIKSENKDGPIITIKLTKDEKIYLDLNDNVLNRDGKIVAIVHQYDRKKNIVRKVLNKYCPELINNRVKNNIYLILIYELIFIIFLLIMLILFLLYKSNVNKNSSKICIKLLKKFGKRKKAKNNYLPVLDTLK